MKNKKFIILFLSILLLLALAACNNDDLPEPTDTDLTDEPQSESEAITNTSPEGIVKHFDKNVKIESSTTACKEALLLGVPSEKVISTFVELGYEELKLSTIEGAILKTRIFSNGKYAVTIYSIDSFTELRVTWEPIGDIGIEAMSPTAGTGSGSVTVAQIGIERSGEADNPLIGMCYVIKLSNGKAIVIDGGFNTDTCSDNLFNSLAAMEIAKVNGKYAIEAWIITHDHGDHSGAYKKFASTYSPLVTVENIISAFPGSRKLVTGGGSSFYAGAFNSARLINPHGGLKYYFGNATISMLYTPDMLYDASERMTYYNNTSLVFKLEAGGSAITFFGDAGNSAARKIVNSYDAATFKSDVFQMTHHGLLTSVSDGLTWMYTKKLYEAIDAHTVLLPMQSRFDGGDGRNGRYTVLIEWSRADFQISYVTNKKDNHGLDTITQDYFNEFTAAVENGTSEHETLYGYDGINKITNENGLVTYLGASETKPMVTMIELSDGNATLTLNQMLYDWLGAEDIQ